MVKNPFQEERFGLSKKHHFNKHLDIASIQKLKNNPLKQHRVSNTNRNTSINSSNNNRLTSLVHSKNTLSSLEKAVQSKINNEKREDLTKSTSNKNDINPKIKEYDDALKNQNTIKHLKKESFLRSKKLNSLKQEVQNTETEENESGSENLQGLRKPKVFTQYANCFARIQEEDDYYYYDLNGIKPFNTTVNERIITISLCRDVSLDSCDKKGLVQNNSSCKLYSGHHYETKSWRIKRTPFGKELALSFPEGENCSGGPENSDSLGSPKFKINALIKCDEEAKGQPIVDRVSGFNGCNPMISLRTNKVCKGEKFVSWIDDTGIHRQFIGWLFLLTGLFITFLGNKFRFVFYLALKITALGIFLMVYVQPYVSFPYYVYLIIAIIITLIIILYFLDIIILAAVIAIGYLIGSVCYIIIETKIELDHFIYYWIIVAIVVIIFILIKDSIINIIIIISSTIFGSLMTIRGFGVFTGSFPDESYISRLLYNREFTQFKNEMTLLIILNAFLLMCLLVAGLTVQYSMNSDQNNNSSNPESGDQKTQENGNKEGDVAAAECKEIKDEKTG